MGGRGWGGGLEQQQPGFKLFRMYESEEPVELDLTRDLSFFLFSAFLHRKGSVCVRF